MRLEKYQSIIGGRLKHSGHDYVELANQYGTPLYIFDEASFRERILAYREAVKSTYFETDVLFASKALLTKAVARIIAELDIGQDVVSAGEIYTGVRHGVDPKRMYFHGNNKLNKEIRYAIDKRVGTIVVDNRMEVERISKIAAEFETKQRVLLRLNPGVEAHTHEYIMTANLDSKFGESVFDPEIYNIIQSMVVSPHLEFAGFHSHIGSQIFEADSFYKAASELLTFSAEVQKRLGILISEINFGGGFGVYYTQEDQPFDVIDFLPDFMEYVHQEAQALAIDLKKVTIEPGRSLVNASGSTLYEVGDLKHTAGGKDYAFVDGSMNDNIRPALYQAKYEALAVNKADKPQEKVYTIAGKACESGDKIIEEIKLPILETGDLLLVNGTGAYNYSMASNYNRIPRPAMIHVNDEKHYLTVKRESFEEMSMREI
ncbi:diaminopimelate decarboxylase [Fundicoccus sp. Sow4_D5]|uniref:diaminopimelate decarboxylase n=1 Tax=Fundicoccus sp. Sow4_D5 TaxID=3438782 RepID=UPI003F93D54F